MFCGRVALGLLVWGRGSGVALRMAGRRVLTMRMAGASNFWVDVMAESNIQPNTIIPDFGTLKNGKLDILVNWDIASVTKTDDMGNEYTMWSYESARINWVLPAVYESEADIQSYLNANYDEGEKILEWAQATRVNKSSIGT